MRLIDADALIREMHNVILEDGEDRRTFYEVIQRQPTIDAEPARHGKWLHPEEEDEDYHTVSWSCPVCWSKFNFYEGATDGTPYCPNCGAKMDEAEP